MSDDPLDLARALLERQRAGLVGLALPPVVFGGATVAALATGFEELALQLGAVALLVTLVSAALGLERVRRIRATRALIEALDRAAAERRAGET